MFSAGSWGRVPKDSKIEIIRGTINRRPHFLPKMAIVSARLQWAGEAGMVGQARFFALSLSIWIRLGSPSTNPPSQFGGRVREWFGNITIRDLAYSLINGIQLAVALYNVPSWYFPEPQMAMGPVFLPPFPGNPLLTGGRRLSYTPPLGISDVYLCVLAEHISFP